MNSTELSGRLGDNPVEYINSNGNAFLGFPVCVNKSYRRARDGKMIHQQNWFFCSTPANGRLAQICEKLRKGMAVTVKGESSTYQGSWKGRAVTKLGLYLHEVSFSTR